MFSACDRAINLEPSRECRNSSRAVRWRCGGQMQRRSADIACLDDGAGKGEARDGCPPSFGEANLGTHAAVRTDTRGL